MSTIIRVENVSKLYRLGNVSAATLRDDMHKLWAKIQGKEDPTLRLAEANDRTQKGLSDYVWALKDINFEVEQGGVLGVIGRNGAGKSTLLKILSKVTAPTTGSIKVRGRIASLLEVGTGFHPELTGKENIYLNGHILGMNKREIDRKFDEIVDFSGVQKYLDTPVKRYSSGMYVRLAFAVAAHLEPEILIVDEVLAVGDVEFQKKCLGKMNDVSKKDGRTILFVSHNMPAVKELCTTSILLKNGMVAYSGTTNDVLREYLSSPITVSSTTDFLADEKTRRGDGKVRFSDISINNGNSNINPEDEIIMKFKVKVLADMDQIYFAMAIKSPQYSDNAITSTGLVNIIDVKIPEGNLIEFGIRIPPNTLRTGLFPLYFWLGKKGQLAAEHHPYDIIEGVYFLNIHSDKTREQLGYSTENPGGYFNLPYTVER